MTSLGGAYPDVWGICGMSTPRTQGEMSRLGVIMKASGWSPAQLLAAPGTWVRASMNLWRESLGLIIPSINDKPAHFQAFMINSWLYLMCSLSTFPGTAGRWHFLGTEARGPYGHLGLHATFPVPSRLRRPLCWVPARCRLQACSPLLYPTGKIPEHHSE